MVKATRAGLVRTKKQPRPKNRQLTHRAPICTSANLRSARGLFWRDIRRLRTVGAIGIFSGLVFCFGPFLINKPKGIIDRFVVQNITRKQHTRMLREFRHAMLGARQPTGLLPNKREPDTWEIRARGKTLLKHEGIPFSDEFLLSWRYI